MVNPEVNVFKMAGQLGLTIESQDANILKQEISKLSGLIQKEKERRALSTCQSNTLRFSRFSNRFIKSSPAISPTKTFRSGTYPSMYYINSKFTHVKTNRTYQNSATTSKTAVSNNSSKFLQLQSLSSKISSFKSKNLYRSMSTKIPSSSSSSSLSQSNNEAAAASLLSHNEAAASLSESNNETSSSASSSSIKSMSLSEAKSKMVKNAQEDLVKTEAKLQCLKTTYAKLCSSAPFRNATSQNATVQGIINPKGIETKSITSSIKKKPLEPSQGVVTMKQPSCLKNITKSQVIKISPKISHTKSDFSLKSWIKTSSVKKVPLMPASPRTMFPQRFSALHLSTITQKSVPQPSKSPKSPLVQCHRYKIVRKHGVKKPTTPLVKTTKVLKQNSLTTRFKLIKSQSSPTTPSSAVGLPLRKTGYSYFSSKSLLRARALNRGANSVIAKDYKRRLAALLIDFGKVSYRPKKLASSNLSKQRIICASVCCTPNKKTLGKTNIPPKFKMKIDRRRRLSRKYSPCLRLKSSPFSFNKTPLKLNMYRSFSAVKRANFTKFNSLKTITVRGVKFHVEAGGKTLRRMDTKLGSDSASRLMGVRKLTIGGVVYTQTSGGMLKRIDNPTVVMANRVVTRSIATATAKLRKGYSKPAQKPCLFYNRFGKCNKGNKCPYIHDPKKIAVCYRTIRGGCKVENCPFYHQLSKEKMPSCSYFLKGQCNRENCIYPHVKVNKNAIICEDFLNGYCSLGEKCTRKHSLVCQKFRENQVCSHHACKFNSRKKISRGSSEKPKTVGVKRKRTNSKSFTAAKCHVTKKSSPEELASLSFISLVNSSDDSLMDTSTTANTKEIKSPKESLRIKPRL